MKVGKDRAEEIRVTYIGGGSKEWAWKFMIDLALEESLHGTMTLYDIDRPAAEENAIVGNQITARLESRGKWHYQVGDSLEASLEGADFVIISILPGTFDEMESDVHLPERLDIWQSVGDTAGPGGMVRALRTIPMYVEIAEAIRKVCPDAWVLNYTNPMSLCVKTLYQVFPEIKAFGCCHEVFGTQEMLARMCREVLGEADISREDILVNVMGINHFTWFTECVCRGQDLFGTYARFIDEHEGEGFDDPAASWMDSPFHGAHLVKFDLFRRFHAIAAAGDRHLAEFMPGDSYLKDPMTVNSWKFGLTSVDFRRAQQVSKLARRKRFVRGEEQPELNPSGEEGVQLMKALAGLSRVVSNANLPNRGQIANLPAGAIVETNAVFSADSVKPVMAGEMPEAIRELTMPHVENHELILQAALTCDRELVVEAFLHDPLVKAKCTDRETIAQLVDDMLWNTRNYLPKQWFQA